MFQKAQKINARLGLRHDLNSKWTVLINQATAIVTHIAADSSTKRKAGLKRLASTDGLTVLPCAESCQVT
jgi:hypothetical protein